jgi:hypothetical protein
LKLVTIGDDPPTLAIAAAGQQGYSVTELSDLVNVWSAICQQDLWTIGMTIDRMGLAGLDLESIKRFVERGEA